MLVGVRLLSGVIVSLAFILGCAAWKQPVEKDLKLKTSRMSPDSIGLDYGFIRVPAGEMSSVEAMWQEIDETRISPERRRLLLKNGIRCGIVGEQLPDTIRQLLDQPRAVDVPSDEILFEIGPDGRKQQATEKSFRRLHSRSGQPSRVVASDVLTLLDVIVYQQGHLIGRTFRDAQCIFLLKSFPREDGRVRLELTPEIHHGTPQRDIVADMGRWRFDMSKKREIYESLRMVAVLSPGESLLVAPTPIDRGLGKSFLVPHGDVLTWKRKMLIVRVSQTQHDAVFSAEAGEVPPVPRVH